MRDDGDAGHGRRDADDTRRRRRDSSAEQPDPFWLGLKNLAWWEWLYVAIALAGGLVYLLLRWSPMIYGNPPP